VQRLTKWRLCMSYNDSYFSEPRGELKRITCEMEHAVTRSHDRAAEQRDPTSGQTLMPHVLDAKSAMAKRGIPYGMFKEMFPKFLAEYDLVHAQRAIEISEKDAADPKGEYEGPNLTFDRLEIMRDFVAKQSDQCAPMVRINPETLLCLIDTIQHHEYVPQAQEVAQQIVPPVDVVLPVVGSGALNLDGAGGVIISMKDYVAAFGKGGDCSNTWRTDTPPVADGDFIFYNVAVRRALGGVYVFTAAYASKYADEMVDKDGNEFIANGWYDIDNEDNFEAMLGNGDELVGWQPLPKWHGA
jgi:hypothetical protein